MRVILILLKSLNTINKVRTNSKLTMVKLVRSLSEAMEKGHFLPYVSSNKIAV